MQYDGILRNIAKRLGFTVAELSAALGYKRASLYWIINQEYRAANPRISAALNGLEMVIESQHKEAQRELERKYADRMEAMRELRKLCGEHVETTITGGTEQCL